MSFIAAILVVRRWLPHDARQVARWQADISRFSALAACCGAASQRFRPSMAGAFAEATKHAAPRTARHGPYRCGGASLDDETISA